MAHFKYRGVDAEGKKISGVLEASVLAAARSGLMARGLQVERIRQSRSLLKLQIGRKKVPRQEIMHLSRQLAAFIKAGVPILEAIEILAQESGNSTLRSAIFEIAEVLRTGEPISVAFAAHPKIFPRFYVDMLHSAELSGNLDTVLRDLSAYLERDVDARKKIRSALNYPIIIAVVSLVVIAVLTLFVLPRFGAMFDELGGSLPLPTRILMGTTDFVGSWWWAIAAGMVATVVLLVGASRTSKGELLLDRLLIRLPVLGDVVRFSIIERFCRILSAMVSAGVPLPEAMVVVGESCNNAVYERAVSQVRESMLEGEGLAGPIARTKLFPSTVTQMVRVGENTGTLDEQLETAAHFFEVELTFKIKAMTALFEPAVVIGMGGVVGFVALAVVSAMFGIYDQVGSFK